MKNNFFDVVNVPVPLAKFCLDFSPSSEENSVSLVNLETKRMYSEDGNAATGSLEGDRNDGFVLQTKPFLLPPWSQKRSLSHSTQNVTFTTYFP